MKRYWSYCLFYLSLMACLFPQALYAQDRLLNLYGWNAEIPDSVIKDFEHQTGIKVNFSTYENNEIMYAKLRAVQSPGYDIVMPSSYFVDRMRKQGMLLRLDKNRIPNFKNIFPKFLNASYDPDAQFSAPHLWGITGIFYNDQYYAPKGLTNWTDFWDSRFTDKLMLLDDTREIFSMALLALGYSPNDSDPDHIKAAYLKLKSLMPNVKVFSSDNVASIITDEDATIGMAWNGDVFKATAVNPHLKFVFPNDGFVIWVDTFCILKNAPHPDAAYQFINYMLRADVAKIVAIETHYSTANLAALKQLPADIRNNPIVYPPQKTLDRGQFQMDLSEDTLALYEHYWEKLKISG